MKILLVYLGIGVAVASYLASTAGEPILSNSEATLMDLKPESVQTILDEVRDVEIVNKINSNNFLPPSEAGVLDR